MAESIIREIPGESAMLNFGREVASRLGPSDLVFVRGDLGAGKTTLVRGILRGLGHEGTVPSPTFTLLESYRIDDVEVVHMDFYRLEDPGELEMLGVRDFLGACLCLIEWPERARDVLPAPDIDIAISGSGKPSRRVEVTGRVAGS